MLGLVTLAAVSVVVLAAIVAITTRVEARTALSDAVDAAAVAARQTETEVSATLRVQYATYTCRRTGVAAGSPSGSLQCASASGNEQIAVSSGDAFSPGPDFGFGPDPGWAETAGCAGTRWHRPSQAGSWRICLSQALTGAAPLPPDRAAALAAAKVWLAANLARQSLLTAGSVTALSVGAQGQVTVAATARLRWPMLGGADIRASATAWPGR